MDTRFTDGQPKQEIKLSDYRPSGFSIQSVDLTFDVGDEEVTVKARSHFKRQVKSEAELVLNGGPFMTLTSVVIDGVQLTQDKYHLSSDTLTIPGVPDDFVLNIETRLKPHENTRLEGLYASGGNLCTQCEAEGFRHITYFLDRPDVLAVYTVRIEADEKKYPVLLSNGNLQSEGAMEQGRHFAVWHDPHPKPCYLFALVAGNLAVVSNHYRTQSGRNVALNIYVREHDLDKCNYAMQSLKRSMKWDEETYGLEYDLDVYNIVAVSDFNMGAMENKGLNIFNTKYVLASEATATDSDFDHVEGVIGHEYFHNWTGNRVTCRDWFQLSLKEGLTVYRDQEFSSDMTSRPVKRIEDVKLLRMLQFPEDAGPLAHPIRPESYVEINNFYTTTVYNKGAEVIRMMSRVLGEETFREGVRHYLSKHDGQAATCEDFVQAHEAVSGADLSQFRLWYSQAGTPTIKCEYIFENGEMKLTLQQNCPATPGQPHKMAMQIPVVIGWLDKSGKPLNTICDQDAEETPAGTLLHLTQQEQTFVFQGCTEDAVPSLLRGFSAPVKLEANLSGHSLAMLFSCDPDPFARWQAGQDIFTNYLLSSLSSDWQFASQANDNLDLIQSAVKSILQDVALDPAFAAELLSVPNEVYLGQMQTIRDPDGVHRVRNQLLEDIANNHWNLIRSRYQDLHGKSQGQSQLAKASRKLRNLLLDLIARASDFQSEAKQVVLQHFEVADNMTDQFAGLLVVCQTDLPEREVVLEQFYERWKAEELVVDKWFAAQAQAAGADARHVVPRLMDHPAFSISNPNRLRSVVSTFALMNQVNFHASDGSGYNLVAQTIAEVDKLNPQTAARMVAPLGRWAALDDNRKSLMKNSLASLLECDGLSDDVRELAEKSLR